MPNGTHRFSAWLYMDMNTELSFSKTDFLLPAFNVSVWGEELSICSSELDSPISHFGSLFITPPAYLYTSLETTFRADFRLPPPERFSNLLRLVVTPPKGNKLNNVWNQYPFQVNRSMSAIVEMFPSEIF